MSKPKIIILDSHIGVLELPGRALVVPVNNTGLLGNGLPAIIKKKSTGLVAAYNEQCATGWSSHLFMYEDVDRDYLCLAVKDDWHDRCSLDHIREGFVELATEYKALGITSMAIPGTTWRRCGAYWHSIFDLALQIIKEIPDDGLTFYFQQPA